MEQLSFNWSRSIWNGAKITFWMLAADIVLSQLLSVGHIAPGNSVQQRHGDESDQLADSHE
jgi:hypothetical protein